MIVYCDSVVLIYFLDHIGPLQVLAAHRLSALRAAGDQLAISDLTRLECRVRPIRLQAPAILAVFDRFFQEPDIQKTPLTTAVYDRATEIRADYGFKTIDSLHLAAALESGCNRFLTNDLRLAKFAALKVDTL